MKVSTVQISVRSSQLSLDFDSDVKPGQTLLAALVHQESRDCSRLGGGNKVPASEATP